MSDGDARSPQKFGGVGDIPASHHSGISHQQRAREPEFARQLSQLLKRAQAKHQTRLRVKIE